MTLTKADRDLIAESLRKRARRTWGLLRHCRSRCTPMARDIGAKAKRLEALADKVAK